MGQHGHVERKEDRVTGVMDHWSDEALRRNPSVETEEIQDWSEDERESPGVEESSDEEVPEVEFIADAESDPEIDMKEFMNVIKLKSLQESEKVGNHR